MLAISSGVPIRSRGIRSSSLGSPRDGHAHLGGDETRLPALTLTWGAKDRGVARVIPTTPPDIE